MLERKGESLPAVSVGPCGAEGTRATRPRDPWPCEGPAHATTGPRQAPEACFPRDPSSGLGERTTAWLKLEGSARRGRDEHAAGSRVVQSEVKTRRSPSHRFPTHTMTPWVSSPDPNGSMDRSRGSSQ